MAGHLRGQLIYPTACRAWLDEEALAPGTKQLYQYAIIRLAEHYPSKRVNEITVADLVAFLSSYPTWSSATTQTHRAACRRFFAWCRRRGLVKDNPAVNLLEEVQIQRRTVRHGRWLSRAEVERVRQACAGEHPGQVRDLVLIELALNTGLRRAEIAGLCWGAVRLDAGEINVIGKGHKAATIGITRQLTACLTTWRQLYEHGLERPVGANDPIVCAVNPGGFPPRPHIRWGHPIAPQQVAVVVKRRFAECGIQLSTHDLRRSFAGFLDEAGQPLQAIQAAMRHEDPGITARHYLEKDPRRAKRAVADLEI